MDVSIGRWLVLYQTSVVIDLHCHLLTISADHHIYGTNFVYRTSIRHVSSSNGWTKTHAHVAVQQHHLYGKGLRG